MIVVAGAGLAGLQSVVALRSQGYAGELVLLGAEGVAPYDRPPLSKALLVGEVDDTTLEADWDVLDVDRRLSSRALAVEPGVVRTTDGDLAFEALVLATGSTPRTLPGEGALTLRTRDDALALRGVLQSGGHLAVVGAGWIGAEVATAAVKAGVRVTVVEASGHPHASALPAEVAERLVPWWASVDLRLGTPVDRVAARSVHLTDGSVVEADAVLVGVGVRPVAVPGVAVTAGGAVEVDQHLRTSVPGVYAVGDCAAWWSQRYGVRLNVEHWDNALHSPTVAAANVLGGDEVWDPVPYFWSEQWGRMLQHVGHDAAADRLVWREDGERWGAFWLVGDRLVAALTVDRPRDLLQARRLIERATPVDDALLADPSVAVRAAVRS